MSDNWVQSLKTRTPVDDEIQVIVLHSGFQSYATSVKIIVISVDGLLSQIAAIFITIIWRGNIGRWPHCGFGGLLLLLLLLILLLC